MSKLIITALLLGIYFPIFSQIQFLKLSNSELFNQASKQEKYIFVDVFTDWCGPCIRMDKLVFSDSTVAAIYNKDFLCYKADAERESGIEWRVKYDIQFFPSYLFFNAQGKLICKTGSGMSKELFIGETKRAMACMGEKEKYIQYTIEAESIILSGKRGKKLAIADTLLRVALNQQTYLYNLYLTAKLAFMQEDVERAKEYASLALPHIEKLKNLFTHNKYSSKPIPDFVLKMEEELILYNQ